MPTADPARRRPGLRTIRARLLVIYALLISVPYGLLGWFLLQQFSRYYLTRLQDDMGVEATLIADDAAQALSAGGRIEVPGLLLHPPLPLRSQARVLLFDHAGTLVGSSDRTLESLIGQKADEPGVDPALAGRTTRGVDVSSASAAPVAYVSQPIVSDGKVIGALHLAYTLADIQSAQRTLSVIIVLFIALAAGTTSLISLWLTRGITRPLERLSQAAADIAGGRFERRVPEGDPAELAALARSFNRMAEALERTEQARRVSFANIAHDVRTPLGSIRAAAEALAAGAAADPVTGERLLGGLVAQTQYLSRLTDNLLRLATYEGGGLLMRPQKVDLPTLARQAVRDVEARAQAQSVQLRLDAPAACPPVWADADRVLEALFNLLDNALTYTPPGGEICVKSHADPASPHAWVHVADSGPGVPTEALAHVTERFWQARRGRNGASANMGLGLNIVREIVRAHGGRLVVGNRVGGGADFAFSLPLA